MNWTQPNAQVPNYWESDQGGFWITPRRFYSLATEQSSERWALFGGEFELGVYDTLEEAKAAAEPEEDDDVI